MGLKQLLMVFRAVMLQPRLFWKNFRDGGEYEAFDPLRDYAVAIIALVQLVKFPLIGEPRPAMIYALFNFILDIVILYLLSGIFNTVASRMKDGSGAACMQVIPCFALTPFWLVEPFFFAGFWGWFFAVSGIFYTLVLFRLALLKCTGPDERLVTRTLFALQFAPAGAMVLAVFLQRAVIQLISR
ncbi:hypothetical protein CR161_08455 [Prosthecochloris sp. ZM]|uniref:hypothetical protein n=1 Tax=Prosthecochloris sp. ZM TaxID=2283143 RepID=UPI000DF72B8F|nr:hypothetical protein [Prosthecochloris sp. ZM]RDD30735.1 hypothetical protein CR161_08455 [Prosthecochloris sp. ZM]